MADRGTPPSKEYECVLDETIDAYLDLSNDFSSDVGQVLSDPMLALFIAMAGFWIVLQGLKAIIGLTSPVEILKESVFVLVAGIMLLINPITLVNQVFTVTLDLIGSGSSAVMITAATHNPGAGDFEISGASGMTALVCYTEQAMQTVWGVGTTIIRQSTLTDPTPAIYGLGLMLPYLLVVIVYGSKTIVTIFRIVFLATIAPYLIMMFGFGFFRGEAINGVRTLISSFLVYLAATISVAILVYGVVSIGKDADAIIKAKEGISIYNSKFLLVLFLGWAGTALLTEGIGLANSITGSSLSNTAAGVMSAGVMGSAMAILSRVHPASALAYQTLKKGAQSVGNPFNRGGDAASPSNSQKQAADLVEKYNNFDAPSKGK